MNCHRGTRDRRGTVLVLSSFLIIAMLGCLAFAIDLGYLNVVKSELQRSADAAAVAMTRLHEPGPQEVRVATGRCATRKYASAMWPAVCSWRGEISLIWSFLSHSASSNPTLPWPQMPNT